MTDDDATTTGHVAQEADEADETEDRRPDGSSETDARSDAGASGARGEDPTDDPSDGDPGGARTDADPGSSTEELDRKIDLWKEKLLDLSRGNDLVDFSPSKTKSMELVGRRPTDVADALVAAGGLRLVKKDKTDLEEARDYQHRDPSVDDEDATSTSSEPDADGVDTDDAAGSDAADDAEAAAGEDPETAADERDRSSPPDPLPSRDDAAVTRADSIVQDTLKQIALKQKRYLREKGVDTLYLALGTLEWIGEGDEHLASPLFLVSVDLERSPTTGTKRFEYRVAWDDGEVFVNPALRRKMLSERDVALPGDDEVAIDALDEAVAAVEERIANRERWTVEPDVALGIFDFAKYSLYEDLEDNRDAVKQDPIVRAINGEPSALPTPPDVPVGEALDDLDPAESFQVLNADSSQQEAVEAAKRGMNFVLQGPPGTGKSQTIANIVAEKLAAGETVLFVSEKQAALNVVKQRLEDRGLGRFCLEAHGEMASKRRVLESIERELNGDRIASPDERDDVKRDLAEARDALNGYSDALFWSPDGQDVTAYEAFGRLAGAGDVPQLDFPIPDPHEIDESTIRAMVDELDALTAFDRELDEADSHPWQFCTLDDWGFDTADRMRETLQATADVAEELGAFADDVDDVLGVRPTCVAEFRVVAPLLALVADRPDVDYRESHLDASFHGRADRLDGLRKTAERLGRARERLDGRYGDTIYEEDGLDLLNELNGYGGLRYVKPSYYSFKNRVLGHATDQHAGSADYHELQHDLKALVDVQKVDGELEDYEELIDRLGPLYRGPTDTDWDAVEATRDFLEDLAGVHAVDTAPIEERLVDGRLDEADVAGLADRAGDLEDRFAEASELFRDAMDVEAYTIGDDHVWHAGFDSLAGELRFLADEVDALQDWIQFRSRLDALEHDATRQYVTQFLDDDRLTSDDLVAGFEKRFFTAWLNEAYEATDLSGFNASEQQELLEAFRRLDAGQMEYDVAAIQHAVTDEHPRMDLEHAESSEQVTLRREVNKRRRHLPLRELFDATAELVTRLKPCFMMSPLSVAQHLPLDAIRFDCVVFDEASQIMPEDAVSSIIRGDQVIVAGDTKQLPPTSFFDVAQGEDLDADSHFEDLESILDETASVLSEKRLRWHYRSRDDALIDFSNERYYDGRLKTFPANGEDLDTGVELDHVEDGVYDRGGTRANQPEAERVVERVARHAREKPEKSLGVVAFSRSQAAAIRDEIDERRGESEALDRLVGDDDALEGFFVKSLEAVQGDERDTMLFSVGYGPDADGKMTMNFGPLNHAGGERRLNVAVTRAREKVVVVSSITSSDVDLDRTDARGVADFKAYLRYAETRGEDHGGVEESEEGADEQADAEEDGGEDVTASEDGAGGEWGGDPSPDDAFTDAFPRDVYRSLEARGHDIDPAIRASGYTADMAIRRPDGDGYALAIECDGSAYRAHATARDRDRNRHAVLESMGWHLHRVWSPDWATDKESQLDAIDDRVAEILGEDGGAGETDGDGAGEDGATAATGDMSVGDLALDGYEPEVVPDDAGGLHPDVVDVDPIDVVERAAADVDDVEDYELGAALEDLVARQGPISEDEAYRAVLEKWGGQRLTGRVRDRLDDVARDLEDTEAVRRHRGFLWPARGDRAAIAIRRNTDERRRDVTDIPLEELAKALYVILENGLEMDRSDLVLEAARLFGYERLGSNIEERIDKTVELLAMRGAVETRGDRVYHTDVDDIDASLLDGVY